MPRFFVPSEQITEGQIRITGDDAYHIARSLRMAVGDTLTVADMHGGEYECRLCKIRDEQCELEPIAYRPSTSEPPYRLTLYMALPKGDKLETVIQKAVELGASAIVPFSSSRCIKKPKADKQEERTRRLCRIAAEAAKQCGRATLPTVFDPVEYDEMLSLASAAQLALFCYEGDETMPIKEHLQSVAQPETVSVVVGSEGGFSLEEAERARAAGMRMAGLGTRILRCETAPSYALSAISYHYEM
jgi:16S rRNA (uracil1498-N3)-methyltransferase